MTKYCAMDSLEFSKVSWFSTLVIVLQISRLLFFTLISFSNDFGMISSKLFYNPNLVIKNSELWQVLDFPHCVSIDRIYTLVCFKSGFQKMHIHVFR